MEEIEEKSDVTSVNNELIFNSLCVSVMFEKNPVLNAYIYKMLKLAYKSEL
jgi:hypothetical protein